MKNSCNLNRKCGKITFCTQVGKRVYVLNCLYCPQICLQWDVFINHMEEEHEECLSLDHILQPEKEIEKNDAKHILPINNNKGNSLVIIYGSKRKYRVCSVFHAELKCAEIAKHCCKLLCIYNNALAITHILIPHGIQNIPLDCHDLSDLDDDDVDDPLESDNSRIGKSLGCSIKIEKETYSDSPALFDAINNSLYEENEKDDEFTVNVDPNSLYQNSVTNTSEGLNSKTLTIDDLNNFRNHIKEQLQKSEMRLRNQIKEQPATIKKVLIGILEEVRLIKSAEIIKTTPKTKVIPAEPFSSIEDFLKYDSEIQNDEDKYIQLVYDFEHQNAKCLQHYVKLNWKKIVNDGAAQHMCWKGTEKKKPVRSLAVTQALKAACVKKYNAEADSNFEKICIMHFQHAKGRHEKKMNYKSRVKPTI